MPVEFTLVTGDISQLIVRDDEEGEDEYGEDVDAKHAMYDPVQCLLFKAND